MQIFCIFSTFWPYCTTNPWVFTGFPSSDATFPMLFHLFWPYCAKNTGLMQNFPHAHTNIPPLSAESVKFCRYSDPKQFLSVKLFFTYSKISLPEFIYVRLFFTYSEITAQNKMYVCNHFGRNGKTRGRKGTQGVRARYDAELPPFISIVRFPGRPVMLVPDFGNRLETLCSYKLGFL